MKTVNYKGVMYVNPDAENLEVLGLSPGDITGIMAQVLSSDALQLRDEKLQVAAIRIAPLQDAQDLSKATEAESARLQAWKQYRIDLNRIDEQDGFPASIEWPVVPNE